MSAADGGELVSVIVPVFSRRGCVDDAVRSVLAQTLERLECVVVDDCSTDGSAEVVRGLAAADGRVRLLAQEHRGVSAARNTGVRDVRGRFVTFLDSDDTMPTGRVRRQLELLSERGCDAIIGRQSVTAVPGIPLPSWLTAVPGNRDCYYWTAVMVARHHVLAVGGFDESLRTGEDIDLLIRLRGAGLRIDKAEDTFVVRRYFGDNLTYDLPPNDPAWRNAVRRHLARRRASAPYAPPP